MSSPTTTTARLTWTTGDRLDAETRSRHEVPAHVVFRDLPRNDVGKILEREL